MQQFCLTLGLLVSLLGTSPVLASKEGAGSPRGNPEGAYAPGIELPMSEGRDLVLAACTRCHNLAGLEAYQGYWSREQWLAMVESMVKNGAKLTSEGQVVVTDYLFRHYGRKPAP